MGNTSAQPPFNSNSQHSSARNDNRLSSLTSWLSGLSNEKTSQYQGEIAQLLRSNGLAYGSVGQRRLEERPWRLDVTPKLIKPTEWLELEQGLQQRARLKQAMLADIYGGQQLFTSGTVPAQVVYSHHGYLRAVRQVPSSWHLPLCNIDVTRTSDGRWLALGDCCQAPGYVGYALENRLVLSQVLNDQFRHGRVLRQTPYFQALLSSLTNSMDIDERCVLLGYGANHPNHFEHAYLAKFLGYTLVEANDLTVRDQRVWLKTVAGLQRVDVILRFIDDRDTDPLADADGNTGNGVPGLLHAAYANNVQIINPLGVGVLDNPALDAYLEPLCRFYLGEEPLLQSIKTYWLGDPEQRAHVLGNLDSLIIKDINDSHSIIAANTGRTENTNDLLPRIAATPHQFVAIERIDREVVQSTADASQGYLPMRLRTYLANTGERFEAMAGGLCLLDDGEQSSDKFKLDGSKDVWVLSNQHIATDSLLSDIGHTQDFAMLEGELPSRVADNLFWFGRYAERTENTLRNLRSSLQILRRFESSANGVHPSSEALAVQLRATTTATGALPGFVGAGAARRLLKPDNELHRLIFSEDSTGCLANTLRNLLNTSDAVRDRISYDLLRVLNRVDDHSRALQQDASDKRFQDNPARLNQLIEHINNLLDACAAISGMTHESFTHGDGWQFMMMGRRIERARQSTAIIGSVLLNNQNDPAVLENLLRNFDSVMTYRSRYRSQLDARLVLNLLLLDESNPRSVAYQFVHLDRSVRCLPGMRRASHGDPLLKLVTAGLSRVRLADPTALLANPPQQRQTLKKFVMIMEEITEKIANSLSANYLTHTDIPTSLDKASLLTASLDSASQDSNGDST